MNHSSCGRMSQQLHTSRVWSPDAVPLDLQSSVHGCQRYVFNRLSVQKKKTCGALGRSITGAKRTGMPYVSLSPQHLLVWETLPFAARRASSGTAAPAAPRTPGAAPLWLAEDLVKKCPIDATPSQNSNGGRDSPKRLCDLISYTAK